MKVKKLAAILMAVLMLFSLEMVVGANPIETEPVPFSSEYAFIEHCNIALNGDIIFKFYVDISDDAQTGYMILSCLGSDDLRLETADCDKAGDYFVAPIKLHALQLAELVTIKVYTATGALLDSKSKSPKAYVDDMVKNAKSTETEKAIGKELIKFGHYAQIACVEQNPENSKYATIETDQTLDVSDNVFEGHDMLWKGHDRNVSQVALSLTVDYRISMNIYFLMKTAPEVTIDGVPAEVQKVQTNKYVVQIPEIPLADLLNTYVMEVNGKLQLTLEPLSYGASLLGAGNESAFNAMKALYSFYAIVAENLR